MAIADFTPSGFVELYVYAESDPYYSLPDEQSDSGDWNGTGTPGTGDINSVTIEANLSGDGGGYDWSHEEHATWRGLAPGIYYVNPITSLPWTWEEITEGQFAASVYAYALGNSMGEGAWAESRVSSIIARVFYGIAPSSPTVEISIDAMLQATEQKTVQISTGVCTTELRVIKITTRISSYSSPLITPVPYILQIRTPEGALVGMLKDASGIILEEGINEPKRLSFYLPASDFRLPDITGVNEIWVWDIAENAIIAKFKIQRREDEH